MLGGLSPKKYKKESKMFKFVVKRDGSKEVFDSGKIANAICKAGRATRSFGMSVATDLAKEAVSMCLRESLNKDDIAVEELQDTVEFVLMKSVYTSAAKAYIVYRDQHAKIRDLSSKSLDLVDGYLGGENWLIKENSNMGYSLQGLNNHISSEMSKVYWLNKMYTPSIKDAHQDGDIHIHDLGQLSVYCIGWDLMDLLVQGFCGVPGKMESAPAKHFRSALGQIVNFLYTLQGEAAGAQAFSNFDTLLAPFVRADELSYKDVKQGIQEFVFNMNVPTRVGFQQPFSNITLDLTPSKLYADQNVIIGGKPQDSFYKDYQSEMNMINKAFLEVMGEGDAKGRVFTFPIPTYNITKDFNWEDENLEYLWKATAKYGVPYFSNFIGSDMDPDDARSMCCRLRLDTRKLYSRGGGLFGANPLTGSIGVVTINLPRIAYLSNNEEEFFKALDDILYIAKESLEIKRSVLEKLTDTGLYPYTKHYLCGVKQKTGKYWSNHFSTIGVIGMNEACINLFRGQLISVNGKLVKESPYGHNIGTKEGLDFAEKVLNYLRDKISEMQEQTGHFYNLEATPAEGTSYRLAKIDKAKYPDIYVANEINCKLARENNEEVIPFYTNSSQLPVNYTEDIFEALDKQDSLQTKYTGGTVMHLFSGERVSDYTTIKTLVKKVCEGYKLPYFTFSPTFSICGVHGYIPGEVDNCPICGARCEVYSRIVGYLRPVSQWNVGKTEEFAMRKTFKV